jgi:sugar porter (SP) family MFS transporter
MNRENKPLFLYTFITVFGGLIVGLNMAGISGAVPFLQEQFMLDDMALGLVVSILTVGCLCGALLGGGFSDRYGRQKVMFSSAIFFIVSSLGCALSVNLVSLLVFRLVCGLGIGVISAVAPIYISEISPARLRGTLVSYNQLAIVIGILIAYIVDYILLDYERNWRLMLGFPFFFSVAYLLLLVILPESPRWLSARGKAGRARQVASKLNLEAGEMTVSDTNTQEGRDRIKVTELFKGNLAKVVFIGSILAALQQITGINVIINYAPSIFEMTGVAGDIALVQSILVGVVNLLFTLIAVWLVDKGTQNPASRRKLGNESFVALFGLHLCCTCCQWHRRIDSRSVLHRVLCSFAGTADVGGNFRNLSFPYPWNGHVTLYRSQLVMYVPHRSVFSLDTE